jgi:hypothetical protein
MRSLKPGAVSIDPLARHRSVAESVFERNQRREAEINNALKRKPLAVRLSSRICNA